MDSNYVNDIVAFLEEWEIEHLLINNESYYLYDLKSINSDGDGFELGEKFILFITEKIKEFGLRNIYLPYDTYNCQNLWDVLNLDKSSKHYTTKDEYDFDMHLEYLASKDD